MPVQRGQGHVQRLGDGDVPRVVGGEVVAELPDPVGDWLEREDLDVESQQVRLRSRGLETSQPLTALQAPQDVGRFGESERRRGQR